MVYFTLYMRIYFSFSCSFGSHPSSCPSDRKYPSLKEISQLEFTKSTNSYTSKPSVSHILFSLSDVYYASHAARREANRLAYSFLTGLTYFQKRSGS